MNSKPCVLWIDEDQAELPIIKWLVEKCGGYVHQALSVKEAIDFLNTETPRAILLDCIVRKEWNVDYPDRYTGLVVFKDMSNIQKERTIVLSIVPYDDVLKQMQYYGYTLPRDRFFWKLELNDKLVEFENVVTKLIGECI